MSGKLSQQVKIYKKTEYYKILKPLKKFVLATETDQILWVRIYQNEETLELTIEQVCIVKADIFDCEDYWMEESILWLQSLINQGYLEKLHNFKFVLN